MLRVLLWQVRGQKLYSGSSSFQLSVAMECRTCKSSKTNVFALTNHKGHKIQRTNQNSKLLFIADANRGKKCVSASRLVLVLPLIG